MMETTVLLAINVTVEDGLPRDEIDETIIDRLDTAGGSSVVVGHVRPLSMAPGVYISCVKCGSLTEAKRSIRLDRHPVGECCA